MAYPDPVYPFGSQHVVPMPPFMEPGNGLEVNGLKLGVNIADPITANVVGALTLKLGAGLSLNSNGALTSNSFANTKPPLAIDNTDDLILQIGAGLQVDSSGALEATGSGSTLTTAPPLQLSNDTLTLLYGGALKLNGNTLEVNAEAPLRIANGQLSLNLGNGLVLQGDLLTPNVSAPLTITNNAIGLNFGSGLQLTNGVLTTTGGGVPPPTTYTFQPPITDSNGVISLSLANPITVSGNSLSLQLSPQLGVNASGELTPLFKFLSPLAIDNDGVTLRLNVMAPLSIASSGNLQLTTGSGLEISDNKLTTKLASPLSYTSDAIGLNLSEDLRINDAGQLASTFAFLQPLVSNKYVSGNRLVNLTYTAPLYSDPITGLSVKTGNGINISGDALGLAYAPPLYIEPTTGLSLRIGNGLTLDGDTLATIAPTKVAVKNPLEMIDDTIGLKYAPGLSVTPYGYLKADMTPTITTIYNAGTQWMFCWYKYDIMYVLSVGQAAPTSGGQTLTFSNAPYDFYQFLIDSDTGPSGNGWVSPLGATQTYGGQVIIKRVSDMYSTFTMSLTTNDHFGHNVITSWTAVKYGSLNP